MNRLFNWITNAIENDLRNSFEAWYIEYHSRFPQKLSEEQIDHLRNVKLLKSRHGQYYCECDVYHEFEAYKAGRLRS